ncbi:hypothetical protein, partial [Burkholderia stagnalis]|uniref:hypothetical protein n=1 Tax=Burkholderia stagnalis TaxID=1503054 RepID=UPI001ABAFC11
RQDGAATAAPSDKKLGKITSTKVGSIYPTLTLEKETIAASSAIAGFRLMPVTIDCGPRLRLESPPTPRRSGSAALT